jgi:hypothetical protein
MIARTRTAGPLSHGSPVARMERSAIRGVQHSPRIALRDCERIRTRSEFGGAQIIPHPEKIVYSAIWEVDFPGTRRCDEFFHILFAPSGLRSLRPKWQVLPLAMLTGLAPPCPRYRQPRAISACPGQASPRRFSCGTRRGDATWRCHGKETQRRAVGKASGIDGSVRLKWL